MARTVCSIPTSPFDHDLDTKLEVFLQQLKFKKVNYQGEELYRISNWLWAPAYLKIVHEDGFLHIEAFYFRSGRRRFGSREMKIGTGFLFDPHDMQGKIDALSVVVGGGLPLDFGLQGAGIDGQQQSHQPNTAVPGGFAPDGQQDAKGKNPLKMVFLIGCAIIAIPFLCLLGLLVCAILYGIFLGLFYPETLEDDKDAPAVMEVVDSTAGGKTLNEDRYSFQYPANWRLLSQDMLEAESKPQPKASPPAFLGKRGSGEWRHDDLFPTKAA